MTERRTLLALLLIVFTVVLYVWGKRSAAPADKSKPAVKADAEERVKAEPFPAVPEKP